MSLVEESRYRIVAVGITLFLIVLIAAGLQVVSATEGDGSALDSGQASIFESRAYFPLIIRSLDLSNSNPPPIPVSGTPPIDFSTIRSDLQRQNKDLAFAKIGFHVGPTGNLNGIGCWWEGLKHECDYQPGLDPAGVPVFLKSSDSAGPLFEVQELAKRSGVPHTLVFRFSVGPDGQEYDVPDYYLPPKEAAQKHWALHASRFPPELDRKYVWFETLNEIARSFEFRTEAELDASPLSDSPYRSKRQKYDDAGNWILTNTEWLAEFAIETVRLAKGNPDDPNDDYRWAAFGWSAGEPEPEDWEGPRMRAFLRLAAANPDTVAVALHEYSYNKNYIGQGYPYLIGRFQFLFQACDKYDIPRPTVLITEWGWEYQDVPAVAEAMDDIRWAAQLYAAYPQVKGAAIWNLGGGVTFGDIHHQVNKLILPLRDYSRANYFEIYPSSAQIEPDLFSPPPPRDGWDQRPIPDRIHHLLDAAS